MKIKPPRTIAIILVVCVLAGCHNSVSVSQNGTRATATPSATPQDLPQTKPPEENQDCDPNYTGGCVPIATDVDCEGRGGNGPAYVKGPIKVIGKDIYQLDRDGNGIACE